VFASVIAAGMPLLVAGLAIPTSLAIIGVLARQTEMSIYVLNIATNVAQVVPEQAPGEEVTVDARYGVMVFSLEMPKEQLANRMMCSEGRVNLSDLRKGNVAGEMWDRLVEAADRLSQLPIWVDDTPAIGPLEVRAKARRVQAELARAGKSRLGLVVVDYMQLMSAKHLLAKNSNREQEVSLCSQMLKDLSKELAIPVLALAQLKRDVEKQKEKRPVLSDLRESGALEQNADTVIFLHREEYYLKEKTPSSERNVAEFIVQKQRNGPLGTARTWFWGSYVLFTDEAPLGRAPLPVEGD
jgi:replicative DNA helicase